MRRKILLAVMILGLASSLTVPAAASVVEPAAKTFSPIFSGVSEVAVNAHPGPMLGLDGAWSTLVEGSPGAGHVSSFALARVYGAGRAATTGHEAIAVQLGIYDNAAFVGNLAEWLDASNRDTFRYSTGHGELLDAGNLGALASELTGRGFSFGAVAGPITPAGLAGVGVLLVGRPGLAFTADEIAALEGFVAGGGGLWMVGQAWSWSGHPSTFPLNQLGETFGVAWLPRGIHDQVQNTGNTAEPVFTTFHPDTHLYTVPDAEADILLLHATYGGALPGLLESDAGIRDRYAHAQIQLAQLPFNFPPGTGPALAVADFCQEALAAGSPSWDALRKSRTYPGTETAMAFLRERFYRTCFEALDPDPSAQGPLMTAADFPAAYRGLADDHGVYLADNTAASAAQLAVLDDLFGKIPKSLHDLAFMSINDLIGGGGAPPAGTGGEIHRGTRSSVNIFGLDVGDAAENSFPADVPAGLVDVFTVVVAHETNHIVNKITLAPGTLLGQRQNDLIAAAGNDHLNYLRSMLPDGFFVTNPQEFLASISNQWFTDSQKTLDLGLVRFDAGRSHPLNQALFVADIYSEGGLSTWFYATDTQGQMTRRQVTLTRDGNGHVDSLLTDAGLYEFILDAAGNVLAYQATLDTCVDDLFEQDDLCGEARAVSVGLAETHAHCDEDWIRFSVLAGNPCTASTGSLTGGADTVLELFGGSCGSLVLLAADDDGGVGLASRLEWIPASSGTQWMRVSEFADDYQDGEGYDLFLECSGPSPSIFADGFESASASAWSHSVP